MKLYIKDIIGIRCIIKDDGQKIFDKIYPIIKNGEEVVLDFSEVTQFASPFFNFAIGQLLRDVPVAEVRRLLHIENINDVGKKVVGYVIESANQYHKDVDFKRIVDEILEQQTKGAN